MNFKEFRRHTKKGNCFFENRCGFQRNLEASKKENLFPENRCGFQRKLEESKKEKLFPENRREFQKKEKSFWSIDVDFKEIWRQAKNRCGF